MEPILLGVTTVLIAKTWGVTDVTLSQDFYVVVTYMLRKAIHVPNCIVVAHAMDSPNTINTTKIIPIDC